MPLNHRLGLDDEQERFPVLPETRKQTPEASIGRIELGAFDTPLQYQKLLTQSKVLC
jgi:hypothetical protein